ncbi:MAG: hypothetical protein JWM68_1051 [Verrucomicrobiales bacterium]|nr:hypothetical protein [Verrucomicrobiales bacterium]
MKWQFLRDHHRRQDKALKAHYRDEMLQKRKGPDRTSVARHASMRKRMLRFFELEFYEALFLYEDYQFRFGFSLKRFSRINGIDETAGKRVLPILRRMAEIHLSLTQVHLKHLRLAVSTKIENGQQFEVFTVHLKMPNCHLDQTGKIVVQLGQL